MTIEAQATDLNQDGSVSITIDGKPVKFVKESDLGAVKGALTGKESEITKLQTDLATANSKIDGSHQDLLKERAAKEQFEISAGESATLKTKVGELETEMAGVKTSSGELETKFTERLRSILTDSYHIDAEKIKEFALADLERTEQTLILTGAKPAPADYDGKGGGSGNNGAGDLEGKSPLALATMGYEANAKK